MLISIIVWMNNYARAMNAASSAIANPVDVPPVDHEPVLKPQSDYERVPLV